MATATLPNTTRWLKRCAFAAGVVAAVTLVAIGRVPAGTTAPALDATVTTEPTGELVVAPVGLVAHAADLEPGKGTLAGRVALRNQTDAPLSVRVRMRPSISDADGVLQVRVLAPSGVLYSGPAGGLRRASAHAMTMRPRSDTTLSLSAWVPADAGSGWRDRRVALPLEYVTSIRGKVRR
jgi:hypothetical protein